MPLELITQPDDSSTLAYLHRLAAYNQSKQVDRLLDVARRILLDGGYIWQAYTFPQNSNITLVAGGNLTGTLSIPAGTIIYAINCSSDQPEGIRFRIYDKSARSDISAGNYVLDKLMTGKSVIPDANNDTGDPFGPGLLLDPLVVLGPNGSIQVDIVNGSSSNVASVQVCFCCAVPINNITANTNAIGN